MSRRKTPDPRLPAPDSPLPTPDLLAFERQAAADGFARVAGVDEAGRGPLAGPVVAAAFCAPLDWLEDTAAGQLRGLIDSKQLTPARREHYFEILSAPVPGVSFGIAFKDAAEIDRLNILRATHAAMAEALAQIEPPPALALVDGLPVKGLPCPHRAIVKGDALSLSIAAASVLAKVSRDRFMVEADARYPGYGFARHKGYGTAEHLAALDRLGPSPLHRRSFAPVAQLRFPF